MSDISEAASRRKAHEAERREDSVSALLQERQGYVNRVAAADEEDDEKTASRYRSRVEQVDEQLRYHDAGDRIPAEPRRGRKAAAPASPGPGA
jgi:hypothetical protein